MKLLLGLLVLFAGCGQESPKGEPPLAKAGLYFTTTDSKFSSSKLWVLGEGEEEPEEVLTGQAGDHLLLRDKSSVILVNRSEGRQNLVEIDLSGSEIEVGEEKALEGFSVGDPAAVVITKTGSLLAANQQNGDLLLLERESGKVLKTLDIKWNLPEGVSLRPGAMKKVNYNGQTFVLLVHFGFKFKDGLAVVNGSQTLFVLEDFGGDDISPVDLDSKTPKIDGRALRSTSPTISFDGNTPILSGLCASFLKDCKTSIETLDLESFFLEEIKSIKVEGFGNGSVFYDSNLQGIIASLQDSSGKKTISALTKDGKVEVIHEFPSYSFGCCALFGDYNFLYVGDRLGENDEAGRLDLYESGEAVGTISLEGIPYQGVYAN